MVYADRSGSVFLEILWKRLMSEEEVGADCDYCYDDDGAGDC